MRLDRIHGVMTRRQLGKMALAAGPLCLRNVWAAAPNSKIRGVQIGVQTYSFRQGVPKTEIIPDMVKIGLSEAEAMSGDIEALAGAPKAPGGGGRNPSPEQRAAMDEYRKSLTAWQKATTPATFEAVLAKFKDAGIDLHILCYNMGRKIEDDEIDYAFRMAKALKVKSMSSSSTVTVAKRVAPFADKYKIMWGGHGHDNVDDPEEFAKPETFEQIMSFSKYIGVNLDIGHFHAAGYDPVPFIEKHHARITNIHLKDRKKNEDGKHGTGANLPWGEADTPIKEVLLLMRKEKYPFPANIEMEYRIPEGSDPVAEVTKCYEFAKKILES
jgi:sugar phosphate isomerase/epimerase